MSPIDVYNSIVAYKPAALVSICDVRTCCVMYSGCQSHSTSKVIDFDDVAIAYGHGLGVSRPSSVDAIAVDKHNSYLILIEKKTWYQFFQHLNSKQKKDPLSASLAKLDDYDLQKKYEGTCLICEHITSDKSLFTYIPHFFVFLTELSTSIPDPTAGFATMLGSLATSSSWLTIDIKKKIVAGMESKLSEIKCANHRYLSCNDFDTFISNPY